MVEPDYETILVEVDGPVATLTMNRPDNGNMFNATMLRELRHALEVVRSEVETRVIVLTGAGERFFCIGGEHDDLEDTFAYSGSLPTIDLFDLIDRHPKPVIASVNGFAVGGGNVLHVVCDLTIAKESAVFRQVGPAMGSFDAGYGTWYLEDLVGRKRAKQIWYLNEKFSANQALVMGLVNYVVPDADLQRATLELANRLAQRGSAALATLKLAFAARQGGVGAFSRVTQDLLWPRYLRSEESIELGAAFREKRDPDPARFNH